MFGLNRSRSKPVRLSKIVKVRSAPRLAALKIPTMAKTPKDEIVEREDPATFSPQRRKAIYDGLLSLDVSPERANAFIDHPKSWELRPIKFVAYDEGLYEALQRAAR